MKACEGIRIWEDHHSILSHLGPTLAEVLYLVLDKPAARILPSSASSTGSVSAFLCEFGDRMEHDMNSKATRVSEKKEEAFFADTKRPSDADM